MVDALERAAQTKEVRAIVLRIDSPGGTYPAADAIADAVGRARAAGKPVIVSMGDVAASGGYLAAVRADVIVAQPTTITASIGVFSIWPVAQELLTSLGVKVERVSVGPTPACIPPSSRRRAAQRAVVDRELDVIYADFTRQVGEARKLDANRIDAAARGRVFSGVDAKQAGLVDELGGLQLALSIAKAKAGIDETRQVEIRRYPDENDRWQRVIDRLFSWRRRPPSEHGMPREVREALASSASRRARATSACRRCRRSGADGRSLGHPSSRPRSRATRPRAESASSPVPPLPRRRSGRDDGFCMTP